MTSVFLEQDQGSQTLCLTYVFHMLRVCVCRMSVSLQVPSQQTQRALCSNSRSGQPTAAWHAQGAHSDAGGQQFPPLQQQNSSSSSTAASESGVIGSCGDAAAEADVAAARCLQKLESKQPHWNGALRVWCLNFNGRVGPQSSDLALKFVLQARCTENIMPALLATCLEMRSPDAPATSCAWM